MDKQLQKQSRLNSKWLDKKIQEIQKTQQFNSNLAHDPSESPATPPLENDDSLTCNNQDLSIDKTSSTASVQKSKSPSKSTNNNMQQQQHFEEEEEKRDSLSVSWHSWLEESHLDLGPMPEGWKLAETSWGEIYYVNQKDPNSEFAQTRDPRIELMQEELKETIRSVGEEIDEILREIDNQEHENDDSTTNIKMSPEIKITTNNNFDYNDEKFESQISNYYRKSGVLDPPIHSSSPKKSENVFNFDLDDIQNASLSTLSSFEVIEFEKDQVENNVQPELKNDDEENEMFEKTAALSDHESEVETDDEDEPWYPWLEEREPVNLGPLPENWKMVQTVDGDVCFINYGLPRPMAQHNDPRITQTSSTSKKVKNPKQFVESEASSSSSNDEYQDIQREQLLQAPPTDQPNENLIKQNDKISSVSHPDDDQEQVVVEEETENEFVVEDFIDLGGIDFESAIIAGLLILLCAIMCYANAFDIFSYN